MGNVFQLYPDDTIIKHLNNYHIKILNKNELVALDRFKEHTKFYNNGNSIFTTYPYQKLMPSLDTDFILCKSKTVDQIIENCINGTESIIHVCYSYNGYTIHKQLSIKNFINGSIKSPFKLDLIELHAIITSKSCKTFLKHDNLTNQDDQNYFLENDIINSIIDNFVNYPINKILLLNYLLFNFNILDVRLTILNLYISMIYSFPNYDVYI